MFDASVLVDALVDAGQDGDRARTALRDRSVLPVPSIFAAEALSAVRAMHRRGEIGLTRARGAVARINVVRTIAYPVEPLIDRIWQLRANLSVYDGWYVALAEALRATLVTGDERLARAPGPRCPVLTTEQFAAGTAA